AALWVDVQAGSEAGAVERVLRRRYDANVAEMAARPVADERSVDVTSKKGVSARVPATSLDLVREEVRYARELEALAVVDERLVSAQLAIQASARTYAEDGYQKAYDEWETAWVRLTLPVTDDALLSRIRSVGSLLAEVVLSDRTPRQVKPHLVLRAI